VHKVYSMHGQDEKCMQNFIQKTGGEETTQDRMDLWEIGWDAVD